jgi:hypothetical protein
MGFKDKLKKGLGKVAGAAVKAAGGDDSLAKGIEKGVKKGSIKKGIKAGIKESKKDDDD